MEVYDSDTPSGAPSTPGALTTPGEVQIAQGGSAPVALAHAAGNQGVFVESVAITGPDAADFSLVTPVSEPFLVGVGGQRDVVVAYSGTLDGAEATLDVVHSGGQTGSVSLLPEPGALASWLAGAGLLLGLRARAARRRRAWRPVQPGPAAGRLRSSALARRRVAASGWEAAVSRSAAVAAGVAIRPRARIDA
jgi:hypothetical protein